MLVSCIRSPMWRVAHRPATARRPAYGAELGNGGRPPTVTSPPPLFRPAGGTEGASVRAQCRSRDQDGPAERTCERDACRSEAETRERRPGPLDRNEHGPRLV